VRENSDDITSVTINGKSGEVLPTPSRIDLKSIDDVRLEMARVYRDMKAGGIEKSDGTKLVYVLSQIGKLIELHDIENRIRTLEGRLER
jgi:hypothetical protein